MITMRDIAVRAGVSRSTVSFVLNDKHLEMGVNESTRRRVLQTAKELGYRRNVLAQAIATGKNPVFCFLVPASSLSYEVTAHVLAGALDEADARHYVVQVMRLADDIPAEDVIRRCIELRPTGVMAIYVGLESLELLQQEMERFHIPVAVLDSTPSLPGEAHIHSDDIAGCRQAIAHLVSRGHKRIAFIGGRPDTAVGALRDKGYRIAMEEQGLVVPPGYAESGYWHTEVIDQITQRFFQRTPAPTAVFCADDRTAMVVCRKLRAMRRLVPDDVSVVGFANLAMACYCDPPLTTIAQPFDEMGRAAVRRLLMASQPTNEANDSDLGEEELLPTRLIERGSTAPVKA